MHIRDLRRKLLWGVFFGILVAAGLALWGDAPALVEHLATFDWRLAPLILALTLCNYGLRFLKWQWYLRIIAAALPWRRSLGIFVAGFPMVLTPGKVGELLKSFLLRASNGTPIARSAPVVLAERISDGLAMFVLALAGLLTFAQGGTPTWVVVGVAAAMLVFVLLTRWRRLVGWGLRQWRRLPLVGRFEPFLATAYESTFDLFGLRNLALSVGLGVVSWGCECLALYFTLVGLGQRPGQELLLVSTFTLATSTLIGAVSFLPGGLGATDISLTGLLVGLLGVSTGMAVAATLIIRFFTLWFGVGLGLAAMLIVFRQLGVSQETEIVAAETPAPGLAGSI